MTVDIQDVWSKCGECNRHAPSQAHLPSEPTIPHPHPLKNSSVITSLLETDYPSALRFTPRHLGVNGQGQEDLLLAYDPSWPLLEPRNSHFTYQLTQKMPILGPTL